MVVIFIAEFPAEFPDRAREALFLLNGGIMYVPLLQHGR
jgi:hypothetical protein